MTQNTRMPLAFAADSTQKEMLSREEKFYIKLLNWWRFWQEERGYTFLANVVYF